MSQSIHQEIVLAASPARVYAALTDAAEFARATGAPAEIGASEGSAFSNFGGMIHGRSVELVPSTRVVQAWRVKAWEAGLYSTVRFELGRRGRRHAQRQPRPRRLPREHAGAPRRGMAQELM